MNCRATVAGTPTGLCRDTKTGKVSPLEIECIDDATGAASKPRWKNGIPYCSKGSTLRARCPHGSVPVEIPDPLSVVGAALLKLAVWIGVIYVGIGYVGGKISRR